MAVIDALATLPPKARVVVVMRYLRGQFIFRHGYPNQHGHEHGRTADQGRRVSVCYRDPSLIRLIRDLASAGVGRGIRYAARVEEDGGTVDWRALNRAN